MRTLALKSALIAGVLLATFSAVGHASTVFSVNFFEVGETSINATTDLLDSTVSVGSETATITGWINENTSNHFVRAGTHAVELVEPGTTTPSDLIIATADAVVTNRGDGLSWQHFTFVFYSDGAADCTNNVLDCLPNGVNVHRILEETVDPIEVTGNFGFDSGNHDGLDGKMTVLVQSDVPEPGSLALLGLGLAGLGFSRRKKA